MSKSMELGGPMKNAEGEGIVMQILGDCRQVVIKTCTENSVLIYIFVVVELAYPVLGYDISKPHY